MFTQQQRETLGGDLDERHIATREQAGRKLGYVEGWHVINEANRIFGFEGWDSELAHFNRVAEFPRKIGRAPNQRDGWSVSYVAKVRITVRAGRRSVIREGVGSGHGIDADLGLAHESALKEAETDALKRALVKFGNKFGLALYDKKRENVSKGADDHEPGILLPDGPNAAALDAPDVLTQLRTGQFSKPAERVHPTTGEILTEEEFLELAKRNFAEPLPEMLRDVNTNMDDIFPGDRPSAAEATTEGTDAPLPEDKAHRSKPSHVTSGPTTTVDERRARREVEDEARRQRAVDESHEIKDGYLETLRGYVRDFRDMNLGYAHLLVGFNAWDQTRRANMGRLLPKHREDVVNAYNLTKGEINKRRAREQDRKLQAAE